MRENGSVVAESDEEFDSRGDAEEAVNLVKERGAEADLIDIRGAAFDVARDGTRWRWRLIDEDGNELGESAVSYPTREEARDALGTVKDFAPDAMKSVAE